MAKLYRFAKALSIIVGVGLAGYGSMLLVTTLLVRPTSLSSWFGIFPVYLGAMVLIIAAAMKEDWFTDARKYW